MLVVTSALFVSASIAISGRQNQTAFDQAVEDIQSQIQQVINDVAIGYYPNNATFNCSIVGGVPTIGGTASQQGTNGGCIFLGKVMQFDVQGITPEQFAIMPLAGVQQVGGQEVSDLTQAVPTVVVPSITTGTLHSGLTSCKTGVGNCKMSFTDTLAGAGTVGAVAFVKSLAQFDSSGNLESGSQQVDVIPVGTSSLNATQASTITAIQNKLSNTSLSPPNPSGGVSLCFVSGGTKQSALITIGGTGHELAVTTSIKGTQTCS